MIANPQAARTRRVAKTLAGATCLAALAACAMPDAQQWQPNGNEVEKTNKVEISRLSHTVRFAAGAPGLTAVETTRLLAFLDDADIAFGDRLELSIAGDDALVQKRETAIRKLLAKRGVVMTVSPGALAAGTTRAASDEMTLQFERYVVTPPHCPDWSKPTGGDPGNTVFSNFGCATETNLGMMVAQPRDLVVGRQPGPADAAPGLLPIQNYRAGKPVVLPDDSTGASAPASSAATPGASAGAAGSGG